MDVEGSELAALQGGQALLSSGRVRWINLESRDVAPIPGHPTTAEIDALLASHGYDKVLRYNVHGDYPEAPGDNVYVLRRS